MWLLSMCHSHHIFNNILPKNKVEVLTFKNRVINKKGITFCGGWNHLSMKTIIGGGPIIDEYQYMLIQ
jgi:hypothetical protein